MGGITTTQPPPEPEPEPEPEPTSPFDTAEFQRNWGLGAINLLPAYEQGLSGAGITVAVLDTGVDLDHPDLDDNLSPQSINVVTGGPADFRKEHGTSVSGIVAAEKNDMGIHGVAFNADLLVVGVSNPDDCPSEDDCPLNEEDIADGIDYAISRGAQVLNMSFSGDAPGFIERRSLEDAAAAGAAMVVAAGNDGNDNPNDSALVALDPIVDGHMIIAGASTINNELADFSNKAGTGQDFFLVAPGDFVQSTIDGGGTSTVSGTSFSAPHISGALVLLLEEFPTISGKDAVSILLESATDLGAQGTDPVFGRGLLNVEAALAPIEPTAVPTGETVDEGGEPMEPSAVSSSAAFGALRVDPDLFSEVLILDKFKRPYLADLSPGVLTAPRQRGFAETRLRDYLSGSEFVPAGPNGGIMFSVSQRSDTALAPYDRPYSLYAQLRRGESARSQHIGIHYAVSLGKQTALSLSQGYGLGRVLGERTSRLEKFDFHNRNASHGAYLGIAGREQSIGLSHRLDDKTTISSGMSISTGHPDNRLSRRSAIAAAVQVDRRLGASTAARIQIGNLHERGAILDLILNGAFGAGLETDTNFLRLGAVHELGEWRFHGSVSAGLTRTDEKTGALIGDFQTMASTAFAAGAARQIGQSHSFGFQVAQPLRVENATAKARIPRSVNPVTRRISRESHLLPLAPEGRELDLELAHRYDGRLLHWQTNLIYRHEPDHRRDEAADLGIFTRVKIAF